MIPHNPNRGPAPRRRPHERGAARRPALTRRPAARAAPGYRRVTSRIPPTPAHGHARGRARHIYPIWRASILIGVGLMAAPIGGSGSARLLRSLIPGTSIRFVRVRSYDRPDRSIVTVPLDTSM